jgi:hypothetical protein
MVRLAVSKSSCVSLEAIGSLAGARLHAITAHAVKALRRQAKMADHRDLRFSERAHQLDARAFDFDSFRSGFFDESDGVGEPFGNGTVVAAEGHVGHDQRAAHGTANGPGVVQHLIHAHGERVVMAEDDHGQRIADQEKVYPGFIGEARRRIVVSRERGDGLALALHFSEGRHGDFCDGNARRSGARPGGEIGEAHVISSAAPYDQDAARTSKSIRPKAAGRASWLPMNLIDVHEQESLYSQLLSGANHSI